MNYQIYLYSHIIYKDAHYSFRHSACLINTQLTWVIMLQMGRYHSGPQFLYIHYAIPVVRWFIYWDKGSNYKVSTDIQECNIRVCMNNTLELVLFFWLWLGAESHAECDVLTQESNFGDDWLISAPLLSMWINCAKSILWRVEGEVFCLHTIFGANQWFPNCELLWTIIGPTRGTP